MNIPPFWEKATGGAKKPDGTVLELTSWGWSHAGSSDAREKARSRLSRMIERVAHGEALPSKYPYGVGALREEIVTQLTVHDGASALVTRNGYGSLVLNSPDMMFIDVDLPQPPPFQWVRRMLGGATAESVAAEKLEAVKTELARSSVTFRIYRTAGGFRVLANSRTFTPDSDEVARWMQSLGADPTFVQLCRTQRSFRARLTPKPWRCGFHVPPNKYPRDANEQEKFGRWLEEYEHTSSKYATCAFLEQVGRGQTPPRLVAQLRHHDDVTKAHEPLRLA